MTTLKKIQFYNLREEVQTGQMPTIVGRHKEIERLSRLIGRRTNNNAIIIGQGGLGKTALILGLAQRMSKKKIYDKYALLQLDSEHLYELDNNIDIEEYYLEALTHIPSSILFIDDFGREVYKNMTLMRRVHKLYKLLAAKEDVHIVLTMQPHEHAWLEQEYPIFFQTFEKIILKQQSEFEYTRILFKKIPALNAHRKIIIPYESLKKIISTAKRLPALGQLPRSAIHILDEAISLCISQGRKILTTDEVAHVVESKIGIPNTKSTKSAVESVNALKSELSKRIIGQDKAIENISSILRRAKLGLRSQARPLGSFLMLGPSGVGKTETAKSVAEIMFGKVESFTRIDMSEFQQEHMVQRLIGAPPGYVGYGEGGTLTNALKHEPHSLILLDEIEKAHPKVFDIFLQILDDGRLTSGQGETVDARESIIMATSNAVVTEILDTFAKGEIADEELFIQNTIIPVLSKIFRLEFLNRFDSILIFRPLTVPGLIEIAKLEMTKMEDRFSNHNIKFSIEPKVLKRQIVRIADPRFGARPIKRFIEETCETLVAESLLSQYK